MVNVLLNQMLTLASCILSRFPLYFRSGDSPQPLLAWGYSHSVISSFPFCTLKGTTCHLMPQCEQWHDRPSQTSPSLHRSCFCSLWNVQYPAQDHCRHCPPHSRLWTLSSLCDPRLFVDSVLSLDSILLCAEAHGCLISCTGEWFCSTT
jgi:hypothetical protein